MPRRKGKVQKREVAPDAVYNDWLVSKFINAMMLQGKKSVAERIFYDAMELVASRRKDETPLEVFKSAVNRVKPNLEVKSRRVGGSTYQVPMEVDGSRKLALSFRWLIQFSRKRHEKTMSEKLAGEILDAAEGRGRAIKQKDDTHRMAEANRAFAHYRW